MQKKDKTDINVHQTKCQNETDSPMAKNMFKIKNKPKSGYIKYVINFTLPLIACSFFFAD